MEITKLEDLKKLTRKLHNFFKETSLLETSIYRFEVKGILNDSSELNESDQCLVLRKEIKRLGKALDIEIGRFKGDKADT